MEGQEGPVKLRWNQFSSNLCSCSNLLRNKNVFTDVTLVAEDKQVEAHKFILASGSSFFLNLLYLNPHPHPLVYLRGVLLRDLMALLDFMYLGEVSVQQDHLESFLNTADELKVKGLTENPGPQYGLLAPPVNETECMAATEGQGVGEVREADEEIDKNKDVSSLAASDRLKEKDLLPNKEIVTNNSNKMGVEDDSLRFEVSDRENKTYEVDSDCVQISDEDEVAVETAPGVEEGTSSDYNPVPTSCDSAIADDQVNILDTSCKPCDPGSRENTETKSQKRKWPSKESLNTTTVLKKHKRIRPVAKPPSKNPSNSVLCTPLHRKSKVNNETLTVSSHKTTRMADLPVRSTDISRQDSKLDKLSTDGKLGAVSEKQRKMSNMIESAIKATEQEIQGMTVESGEVNVESNVPGTGGVQSVQDTDGTIAEVEKVLKLSQEVLGDVIDPKINGGKENRGLICSIKLTSKLARICKTPGEEECTALPRKAPPRTNNISQSTTSEVTEIQSTNKEVTKQYSATQPVTPVKRFNPSKKDREIIAIMLVRQSNSSKADAWRCTICRQTFGDKGEAEEHVGVNHVQGRLTQS